MPFQVDDALRYVVENEGSDLHLKVGAPPMTRIHGALGPIPGLRAAAATDETEEALRTLVGALPARSEFDEEGEADFSYSIPSVSRFRVNAFRQRGSISIVCRAIPYQVRTIEDLGLPPAIRGARRGAARDHPADRDHRLGQVDDARGDDRPHQRDPGRAHHHARGPDRVPARRQALDHQPARGRLRHEELRPGDAAGPAPGPRRDPDRRDARRGDGPDGPQRRRDRPPRALDAAHPRRDRDDQPDHRLLPAAPAAAGAGDARLDAARARSRSGSCRPSTATAASPRARC